STRFDSTWLLVTIGTCTVSDDCPGGITMLPPGSVKSIPRCALPPYARTMVNGVVTAFVRLIVTGNAAAPPTPAVPVPPFVMNVVDDVSVAIGNVLSPVCPRMVITAEPGEPTLYDVGAGVIEATMCRLGSISLLVIVCTVTLADRL